MKVYCFTFSTDIRKAGDYSERRKLIENTVVGHFVE